MEQELRFQGLGLIPRHPSAQQSMSSPLSVAPWAHFSTNGRFQEAFMFTNTSTNQAPTCQGSSHMQQRH